MVENLTCLSGALPEELPPAIANPVGMSVSSRRSRMIRVDRGQSDLDDGFRTGGYSSLATQFGDLLAIGDQNHVGHAHKQAVLDDTGGRIKLVSQFLGVGDFAE